MRILYKGIITGAAEHFLFIRLSSAIRQPECNESTMS